MATNLFDLFKPVSFPVSHAHFWLRHRCFLRVSPKPSSSVASSHSGIGAFLWISPEPSSLRSLRLCLLFCVWNLLVPVAFCMFLQKLMFNISFCCCRHNVSNIFVQLTEGRSARDQPKQPPAKKEAKHNNVCHLQIRSDLGIQGETSWVSSTWNDVQHALGAYNRPFADGGAYCSLSMHAAQTWGYYFINVRVLNRRALVESLKGPGSTTATGSQHRGPIRGLVCLYAALALAFAKIGWRPGVNRSRWSIRASC